MVCEKPVELPKGVENGLAVTKSVEQSVVVPENGVQPDSTLSTQCAAATTNGEVGQESFAGQVLNPQTSYYNYYYPGYNGTFGQSDSGRNSPSMPTQVDPSSVAYYMPGYNPYAAGAYVGADGHCVSQAYYTSSGFLQNPVTYGTEALPCYAWDLNYLGDQSNGSNAAPGAVNSAPSPVTTVRSNGIKPSQLYGSGIKKLSAASLSSKSRSTVPTNASQPKNDTQPLKPLNKSGAYYPSPGYANVYHPAGNFQPYSYQKQGPYATNGPMSFRPNVRMQNGNGKFRSNRRSDYEMSGELTCGPRVHNRSNSNPSDKGSLALAIEKDKYNLAEFQTEYEAAKFYVIKSYSEDDVHKSVKYDVWSSTANGNKKLDSTFHDAEVKANETGVNCPIFLFFSVNGSGQFVGVAEMTGKLDFNKSMDFWQLDKWSGFFPVKWHIIKDVPNSQLRHILLENNENRPVTYTRDTQEIGLKQGLEMLKIFKNYLAKSSLLDDLEFYDNREKTLQTQRSSKPGAHQTEVYGYGNLSKRLENKASGGEELSAPHSDSVSALVSLTKNLSVGSDPKVVL